MNYMKDWLDHISGRDYLRRRAEEMLDKKREKKSSPAASMKELSIREQRQILREQRRRARRKGKFKWTRNGV